MIKENKKTPEIRFPGFTEDWEQRKFSDLYVKVTEKNDLTFGSDRIISVANMYFKEDTKESSDDYMKTYNVMRLGDIAFEGNKSKNFAHGRFVENTIGDGIVSHVFDVFRPITEYDLSYWKYFINNEGVMGRTMARCTKSSTMMTNLVANDFLKESVLVPTFAEQKKIGEYFSNLDNLITLHQRKCDALQTLKKSMLQKMFPKKGSSVPEIRFPSFTEDWEQRKLGTLCSLITKGTTPKDKSGNGEVNFVKVENIDSDNGEITAMSKINREEHEGYLKRSKLETDDILFSIAGTLGRVSVVKSSILPANTNQALAIIRTKEGYIPYLTTVLKGRAVEDFIKKNPTIGAQPNLSLEQVSNLEISLPNYLEQKKIGDFFRNLDNLITLHQRKCDTLKELKKGMLQKMFV